MKKSLTTVIKPFGKALQGIAFWVSYNKMYFNNHKLQEAPITLEFCKLLQSNFTDGQNVFQEEMLKKIYHSDVKTLERVDLLIKDKNRKELFAIEFKTDVNAAKIDADINKLLKIKLARPDITCYLIVVLEKRHNKRFIDNKGVAVKKIIKIKNTIGFYKVRRVCKSIASFNLEKTYKANYALLIEVFI
jgi:hypothetical protein